MGVAYNRGVVLYRLGRYADAAKEFRDELASAPEQCETFAMLALSLHYSNQPAEAYQSILEALRINPQYAFAFYARSMIELEMPMEKHGAPLMFEPVSPVLKRLYSARRTAMEAVALEPTNPDYLGHLARIELDSGDECAAVEAADKGLQFNPNHPHCMHIRALALLRIGKVSEAFDESDRALAIAPNSASAHCTKAWALLRAGYISMAEQHFLDALRIDPMNANARSGLETVRWHRKHRLEGTTKAPAMLQPAAVPRHWRNREIAEWVSIVGLSVTFISFVALLLSGLSLVNGWLESANVKETFMRAVLVLFAVGLTLSVTGRIVR